MSAADQPAVFAHPQRTRICNGGALLAVCAGLIMLASSCGAAAEKSEAPDHSVRAFVKATADLVFGSRQQIAFRRPFEATNAQIREDGKCVPEPHPDYSIVPAILAGAESFHSYDVDGHCLFSRAAFLADSRRHNQRPGTQKGSLLFIDVYSAPLADRYGDVFDAQRVKEGYFASASAACQLYLGGSGGVTDLIIVKLRARQGTMRLAQASDRECISRALLRASGLAGAADLPAQRLFSGQSFDRCGYGRQPSCPDLIRNAQPYQYLSSLEYQGLLKPGLLDRGRFEAAMARDSGAAAHASTFHNLEKLAEGSGNVPAPMTSTGEDK